MGMGIARIPIPNTQIPNLVGYNTHTHTQNTQLFIGYSKEILFFLLTRNHFLPSKIQFSVKHEDFNSSISKSLCLIFVNV